MDRWHTYIVHNNFGGYGLPKASSNGQEVNPFKYGGKELSTDLSLSYYDFEARMQLPALGIFQRPDPKASTFPWLNTYSYCAGDPINKIDPDGNIVKSLDEESITNILNSLTIEEAEYVRFADGELDTDRLNECTSESENMVALKTLANSDVSYIISSGSEAKHKEGVLKFNNSDIIGITLMPNIGAYQSPDDNVYIITYSPLSAEHQATNVAHEAYGHAYFYELKKQGFDVNPLHDQKNNGVVQEIDPETGLNEYVLVRIETNNKLKERIKLVEDQARQNYRSRIR